MNKILFIFLMALIGLSYSCTKENDNMHTVKYKVSSNNAMNVSYTDKDGVLKIATNVTSSWTYSFSAPGNGQIVKLIIQSVNGVSVNGSIFIDGQQSTQDDSNTGYVSMTAQVN